MLALPPSLSMVLTATLAPYFGMLAKASAAARNRVLFWGIGVLLLGDLAMALVPSKAGERDQLASEGGRHLAAHSYCGH